MPSVITPCGGGASTAKGCRVYRTTNVPTFDSTWTKIPGFDAEHYDYGGYHSLVTDTERVTIPAGLGGVYLVTANLWFSGNTQNFRLYQVTKNGEAVNSDPVLYDNRAAATTASSGSVIASAAGLWPLSAGDYLELWGWQNSGGALDIVASNKDGIALGVAFLGAP